MLKVIIHESYHIMFLEIPKGIYLPLWPFKVPQTLTRAMAASQTSCSNVTKPKT